MSLETGDEDDSDSDSEREEMERRASSKGIGRRMSNLAGALRGSILMGSRRALALTVLFQVSRYRNKVNFGLAVQVWLSTSVLLTLYRV